MALVDTLCSRFGDGVNCPSCKSNEIVKNGITRNSKQQFLCKNCRRRFVGSYCYKAYHPQLNNYIVKLTKEGLGIRSTARVLRISATTLLKRIVAVAAAISVPIIAKGKTYEVDELRTYVKKKNRPIWIVCAYQRESRSVVSFCTGLRTNKTLNVVLKTLCFAKAERIYTDGLKNYRFLVGQKLHGTKRFSTNRIERANLNLRTHLKRLGRRTICFSRSLAVLNAILKIYFFCPQTVGE